MTKLEFWNPKHIGEQRRKQEIERQWEITVTTFKFWHWWKKVTTEEWIELYWVDMAERMDYNWDNLIDYEEENRHSLSDFDVVWETIIWKKDKQCWFIYTEHIIKE